MQVVIQPSSIQGNLQAPASKSSMQRACAAALLSKSLTIIHHPGSSNDDRAALGVIEQLGAKVDHFTDRVIIHSEGVKPASDVLDCGESGLGFRMFAPIAALSDKPITITGRGSLLARPMDFFDEVFPKLGVRITSNDGRLPITIKGPLKPVSISIDGSLSSQFLTGLLMAYSASVATDVSITVHNLKSKPYVDLTLRVMEQFGLTIPEVRDNMYKFSGKRASNPRQIDYVVEGDWSGGAFLLVAGAIAGRVEVKGLQNTSMQADKKIVDALLDAGADVQVESDTVLVERRKLEPFEFDATHCPDLFPPLVSLAAHCSGVSRIRGLRRLRHKESDRGITLKEEFEKLSTQIDLNDDEMIVRGNGGVFVKNHTLNSHHDHRIAMACAIACLSADFEVKIRNAEAINKSYPSFFEDLQKLGASVTIHPSSAVH